MILKICTYFLLLIIYSVLGWIIETLLYALRDKKMVKRGFLFGPLCPIYGVGSTILTLALYGRTENIGYLFLFSFLICGALEYSVHFILEKCFHAAWWDYSDRRFNLNGRVYLNGLLYMGAGSVVLLKFVQPFMFDLLSRVPDKAIYIVSFIVYSVLILDIATTVADLKNSVNVLKHVLNEALTNGQNFIDNTDEKITRISENVKENEYVEKMIDGLQKNKQMISKVTNRYPYLNLKRYKPLIDLILDRPEKDKQRTDLKIHGNDNDFREDEKEE